jgi:acetate kinase
MRLMMPRARPSPFERNGSRNSGRSGFVMPDHSHVLTINGGSSSIRFAIFGGGGSAGPLLAGKVDRIGLAGTVLEVSAAPTGRPRKVELGKCDLAAAVSHLLGWLEDQPAFGAVGAVGHRVVHGMQHAEPEVLTPRLVAELTRNIPYAPDHLPIEISLIKAIRARHPRLRQVACFDTAFHRTMPPVARLLPIPRRFARKGVERYGFHGLSYQFLTEQLIHLGDPAARRGRVVLAHLGNGASVAAVRDGRSIDTSMGFTPASGLVMGTRSGDLDPGLLSFLVRQEGLTPAAFDRMANHESGLLGVSGTSSDMRDLLARERRDPHAAAAVELFCYQARKWIGSMAAALGGVDTLVFAGGIGENSPAARKRICAGLGHLGIVVDAPRNGRSEAIISAPRGRVRVRVIHTDEELMIARSVTRVLRPGARRSHLS